MSVHWRQGECDTDAITSFAIINVETAPGVTETVSVYSFPKEILTPKSTAKVNALAHADYLFRASDFPDGFVPIRGHTILKSGIGCKERGGSK